jgi:hypothetical protein
MSRPFKPAALALVLSLTACWDDPEPVIPDIITFSFNLPRDAENWQAGFADYPEGDEALFELASEWTDALPSPLEPNGSIYLSGNNQSDDLFMFIKRRLTGLKPNTRYALTFGLEIATSADSGCVGIGGAPGEDVVVKAGATEHEPLPNQQSGGNLRMNIDHGDQSSGGSDAVVIGDIAGTQTDCVDDVYELKILDNEGAPFEVFTGEAGALWALFATDSGFEGTTSVYFTRMQIIADEI